MRARYTTYSGLVKGVARAPEIAEEDTDIMIRTNVTGLINMTQAVLPILLAKNGGAGSGDIINVGSIAGREPYPGGGIYCATKAAVRSFSETLRKELIASRVRVIEVDPGQVETVSCSHFVFGSGFVFPPHYSINEKKQTDSLVKYGTMRLGVKKYATLTRKNRSSRLCDSTGTRPRPTRSTSKFTCHFPHTHISLLSCATTAWHV